MKKVFLTVAMIAMCIVAAGQTAQTAQTTKVSEQKVSVTKVDAKTFQGTKTSGSRGSGYKPTGFNYIDTDGNTYEIHTHVVSKGEAQGQTKCYIQRTSKKSGKTYWKEIPVRKEELR